MWRSYTLLTALCLRPSSQFAYCCLDRFGHGRQAASQVQEQLAQLSSVQVGQQHWQRQAFLNLLWLTLTGQQGRHDVLTGTTPIIGTGAAIVGHAATWPQRKRHAVRLIVAALRLSLQLVPTPTETYHGAGFVVVFAAFDHLRRGNRLNGGSGDFSHRSELRSPRRKPRRSCAPCRAHRQPAARSGPRAPPALSSPPRAFGAWPQPGAVVRPA